MIEVRLPSGTYDESTDASFNGAHVNVTQGRGYGFAPLVSAPGGPGSMGSVTIGSGGRTGTANVLLDDRHGSQLMTDYAWTCATIE